MVGPYASNGASALVHTHDQEGFRSLRLDGGFNILFVVLIVRLFVLGLTGL